MTAFGAIYSNPGLGSFGCPFVGLLWGDAEEDETWVFKQACSRLSFVSSHLCCTFLALDVQLRCDSGHFGEAYIPGTVGGRIGRAARGSPWRRSVVWVRLRWEEYIRRIGAAHVALHWHCSFPTRPKFDRLHLVAFCQYAFFCSVAAYCGYCCCRQA